MSSSHVIAATRSIRVWDPLIRLLHWTFVGGVVASWITADNGQDLHQVIGYVVLGAFALRLVWGAIGSRYARFRQFVRSPGAVVTYLRQLRTGISRRYIGHNPLGGWMIIALLVSLLLIGVTGHLLTTDVFWGDEVMEELHGGIASFMLLLIAAHVGGVIFSSRHHGENLARAMITGRKPAAQASDIV